MHVLTDLVYCRRGDREVTLDLYLGERSSATILWVHGGAWIQGTKDNPPAVGALVERGFSVASMAYRFSSEARFPAQLEDCRSVASRERQ